MTVEEITEVPAEFTARLNELFRPRGIAMIGATDKSRWSVNVLQNLERYEFAGPIHLVNPRGGQVHGRQAYSSIAELPDGVDPCGENGEFHTCVSAGPMFAAPLRLRQGEDHVPRLVGEHENLREGCLPLDPLCRIADPDVVHRQIEPIGESLHGQAGIFGQNSLRRGVFKPGFDGAFHRGRPHEPVSAPQGESRHDQTHQPSHHAALFLPASPVYRSQQRRASECGTHFGSLATDR